MPRLIRLFPRRVGPLGVALTAWDIYRRLPPKQRRWVVQQARQHGPVLARKAMAARRNGRP